ncbi:hypothetical protein [Methyloceanibacter sp.]|uniref:hypothetical protein n=1 Tax=Methyloceanibacter sp. TaxID=1965321 RepID=UPI002D1FC1C7|nr:hypothetical protein [Methyloceanibacter sp.]
MDRNKNYGRGGGPIHTVSEKGAVHLSGWTRATRFAETAGFGSWHEGVLALPGSAS